MRGDRAGFVLIAALWILVALSAVGLQAALESQTRRRASANVVDETRARVAVRAAGEWARSRLTAVSLGMEEQVRSDAAPSVRGGWIEATRSTDLGLGPINDAWWNPRALLPPEIVMGDTRVRVAVRDVGTALNLNEATEEMLGQFFSLGLELDFALADEITQAILDWRDEDDIPRVNGGEIEAYLDDDRQVLPANRGFSTIDEVGYVIGMTSEILELARPHLTLVGSGDINVNSAPYEVLVAAPGMSREAALAVIQLRESGLYPTDEDDIEDILSRTAERRFDRRSREFRSRTDFLTTELEILLEGGVEGSPVQLRLQLVVSRNPSGEPRIIWSATG